MKTHDLQGIQLPVPAAEAFRFIANPANTTRWAEAFEEVDGERARLRTPAGVVEIRLEVHADARRGTIDWRMVFPDGTEADAFSRVVPLGPATSVYSFVLTPPPVPLEQLEGTLGEQSIQLHRELQTLRTLLSEPAATGASATA